MAEENETMEFKEIVNEIFVELQSNCSLMSRLSKNIADSIFLNEYYKDKMFRRSTDPLEQLKRLKLYIKLLPQACEQATECINWILGEKSTKEKEEDKFTKGR